MSGATRLSLEYIRPSFSVLCTARETPSAGPDLLRAKTSGTARAMAGIEPAPPSLEGAPPLSYIATPIPVGVLSLGLTVGRVLEHKAHFFGQVLNKPRQCPRLP